MDIFSASKGNVFPFEIGGDLRGGGWGGGKRQLTSLVVFSVVHMRFISVPDVMGDFEESGREETFFSFFFLRPLPINLCQGKQFLMRQKIMVKSQ